MSDTFESAADYIQSLDQLDTPQHSREYHFTQGIARARHLIERMGGAPNTISRCILVAGSKGKGSTTAMLSSILAATGLRVGVFTGPHLHTPLERFSVFSTTQISANTEKLRKRDDNDLSDLGALRGELQMPAATYVDFANRIRAVVDTWDRDDLGRPTRFEAFTAIAYRWFEEQHTDINVLEIGIGGRLDAVNLGDPMLSVITNISLEHTQILGSTLPEIAREKAGIMRAERPVVIAQQTAEAQDALCAEAARVGAQAILAEDGWHCEPVRHQIDAHRSGQWFVSPAFAPSREFFLPLLGAYQLQNAAAVLAACSALAESGVAVDEASVYSGLAQTRWPGRFELLGFQPIVVADGAHTPYSMWQLCASLRDYFPNRRIHFVVGVLRDKDSRGMLEAVAATAASVTLCDMPVRRATPAEVLLEQWNELSAPRVTPTLAASLEQALPLVRAAAAPDDVICITGSLHLVAEELRIENEELRMKN